MSATDGRLHAATSSERGGRECNSLYPGHFLEGRQIQAGCTCLENRIGSNRGRSITDAFRHFGRVPTLNRNPQRKEILCDLLSVTKASCSIARATNQIESPESDRRS